MALNMGLDVYLASDDDEKVKMSVGTTNRDGVQISHLWISRKITSAKIVQGHITLIQKIKEWERVEFKPKSERVTKDGKGKTVAVLCPYDRSLVTITSDKFDHHSNSKGVDKPKCTRTVNAHGIKLEFVLPNDMLER